MNTGKMPLEMSSSVPIQKSACLVACAAVEARLDRIPSSEPDAFYTLDILL